ncbi:PEP-CTERM sorting domain-containing protein [Thalassomonas sp. RHCl1]|uniref:PEP-CTERM sorting domain-containing protein n=1 Tax=Thalassomonas sp. RHCl1 TaxID=2995320 RepID=UPI00248CF6CB|nr:PEP-CTERM sorting domain-containing protein [Thalassomonas sp. RHCl1]
MRLFKNIALVTTLALTSLTAHAGIITSDWQTAGDNKVSIDTSTGLEWLKITETRSYTFDSIQGELGQGGIFEGWRLPTEQEITNLWRSFFPDAPSTYYHYTDMDTIDGVGSAAALAWTDALGYGYWGTTGFRYSYGLFLDDNNQSKAYGFIINNNAYGHMTPGLAQGSHNYNGLFLVAGDSQPSSVPVPGSAILMLLGLSGLAFARKRKAK